MYINGIRRQVLVEKLLIPNSSKFSGSENFLMEFSYWEIYLQITHFDFFFFPENKIIKFIINYLVDDPFP